MTQIPVCNTSAIIRFSCWIVVICLVVTLLTACEKSPDSKLAQGVRQKQSIPIPQALQRATLPSDGRLTASLLVDDVPEVEMSVVGNTWSATREISDGAHKISLNVTYESTGAASIIPVVTASKDITISGPTNIEFTEQDYNYSHSDSDGYTNLREIEAGTDPSDANDFPSDFDDNYEDNDTKATAYDISFLKGIVLDRSLSTNLGVITTNDSIDYFKISLTDTTTFNVEFWFPAANQQFELDGAVVLLDSGGNPTFAGTVTKNEFINDEFGEVQNAIISVSNPKAGDYFIRIIAVEPGVNQGLYRIKWSQ